MIQYITAWTAESPRHPFRSSELRLSLTSSGRQEWDATNETFYYMSVITIEGQHQLEHRHFSCLISGITGPSRCRFLASDAYFSILNVEIPCVWHGHESRCWSGSARRVPQAAPAPLSDLSFSFDRDEQIAVRLDHRLDLLDLRATTTIAPRCISRAAAVQQTLEILGLWWKQPLPEVGIRTQIAHTGALIESDRALYGLFPKSSALGLSGGKGAKEDTSSQRAILPALHLKKKKSIACMRQGSRRSAHKRLEREREREREREIRGPQQPRHSSRSIRGSIIARVQEA